MKSRISSNLCGAICAAFVITFAAGASFAANSCAENAPVTMPALPEAVSRVYEKNLADAQAALDAKPGDADARIWLGRRTAYLGRYKEAIRIFTAGAAQHPKDARFLRHRGHRYLTLRCVDDAIADFEKAGKLVGGKPDEVEPDGLPNAKNIPTSTLQSNIWYHLGLAYYLKGDFARAAAAYKRAMNVSKNNDVLAATSHWYYMTLRGMGKSKEAAALLTPFGRDFEVIENDDYLRLLRVYRDEIKADALLDGIGAKADSLGNASLAYGIGAWHLYNGDRSKAAEIFRRIVAGNQWASFGFIAAEAELRRLPEAVR
jgi:tetratricopeptide (TPR) repeat protein